MAPAAHLAVATVRRRLYAQFLAVELMTGYYQLYFDTGEGYEPIEIHTSIERLDEAEFAILKTLNT